MRTLLHFYRHSSWNLSEESESLEGIGSNLKSNATEKIEPKLQEPITSERHVKFRILLQNHYAQPTQDLPIISDNTKNK